MYFINTKILPTAKTSLHQKQIPATSILQTFTVYRCICKYVNDCVWFVKLFWGLIKCACFQRAAVPPQPQCIRPWVIWGAKVEDSLMHGCLFSSFVSVFCSLFCHFQFLHTRHGIFLILKNKKRTLQLNFVLLNVPAVMG